MVLNVELLIILAVFVMLFVYFGIMSVLSIFETVATPLNMDEYDWNAQKARASCLTLSM